MGNEVEFQQRWEFRRRENNDSSSDDSKSTLGRLPKLDKGKLVSGLIILDDHEPSKKAATEPQQNNMNAPPGFHKKYGKGKAVQNNKRKKDDDVSNPQPKRDSHKKAGRKKPKVCDCQQSDLKIFSQSLLADLDVQMDKILARMGRQLKKLPSKRKPAKNTSWINVQNNPETKVGEQSRGNHAHAQRPKKKKSVTKAQIPNGKAHIASTEKANDDKLALTVTEDAQKNVVLAMEAKDYEVGPPATKKRKKKVTDIVQHMNSTQNNNGEIAGTSSAPNCSSSKTAVFTDPSMYLTLPSVLTEAVNATTNHGINTQRSNPVVDLNNAQFGYYPTLQQPQERNGDVVHMGSVSNNYGNQDNAYGSGMGSIFPVPLRRDMNNLQSLVVSNNNNALGYSRMNNGEAISDAPPRRSYTLAEYYTASSLINCSGYYRVDDSRRLYPK